MNKIIITVIRNPLLQHGVFWIISFYILLNIFSLSSSFQKIDFIYTGIFLISLIIPVLINLYLLLPYFLRKGKYLLYSILFLGLLFLFSWFNQLIFSGLIDIILPDYFFISYYSYGDILKFFGIFLLVTTLLQLSKEWFELNATRQKMILLEREKIEAELKALSNQVNPHFLFNSLNVLYSLAINQKKEAPEAILKLSDILRYVIYDSAANTTTIESEVRLIQNYLDLQRYRVGDHSNISFDVNVEDQHIPVAPMLFLPLVENGFKHGIKGDIGNTFLNIQLKTEHKLLTFTVENNKGNADIEENRDTSGVGLENIRSRLLLLYPDKYEFTISELKDRFRVELKLKELMG